jgi:hypothetical protein
MQPYLPEGQGLLEKTAQAAMAAAAAAVQVADQPDRQGPPIPVATEAQEQMQAARVVLFHLRDLGFLHQEW